MRSWPCLSRETLQALFCGKNLLSSALAKEEWVNDFRVDEGPSAEVCVATFVLISLGYAGSNSRKQKLKPKEQGDEKWVPSDPTDWSINQAEETAGGKSHQFSFLVSGNVSAYECKCFNSQFRKKLLDKG